MRRKALPSSSETARLSPGSCFNPPGGAVCLAASLPCPGVGNAARGWRAAAPGDPDGRCAIGLPRGHGGLGGHEGGDGPELGARRGDRKSTRLNSSHSQISYAVFCLKKKKNK